MAYTKNENYINRLKREEAYRTDELKDHTNDLIKGLRKWATTLEENKDGNIWQQEQRIKNLVSDIKWAKELIDTDYDRLKEIAIILDAIDQAFDEDTFDKMEQNEFTL